MSTDLDALIEAAKLAIGPGATYGDVAKLLPDDMQQALWERAVDRFFEAELGPDYDG